MQEFGGLLRIVRQGSIGSMMRYARTNSGEGGFREAGRRLCHLPDFGPSADSTMLSLSFIAQLGCAGSSLAETACRQHPRELPLSYLTQPESRRTGRVVQGRLQFSYLPRRERGRSAWPQAILRHEREPDRVWVPLSSALNTRVGELILERLRALPAGLRGRCSVTLNGSSEKWTSVGRSVRDMAYFHEQTWEILDPVLAGQGE